MPFSKPIHAFARLLDYDESVSPALRWKGCSPALLQTALGLRSFPFADPSPGGSQPRNKALSGAHRTTGSSSSQKKKPGEHEFSARAGE
jgi:hypothetical protein